MLQFSNGVYVAMVQCRDGNGMLQLACRGRVSVAKVRKFVELDMGVFQRGTGRTAPPISWFMQPGI